MKNTKEIIFALLFSFALVFVFFYKVFLFGNIPFPGDLLISEYNPWKTYSYLGYNPGSFPNKAQYFDTVRQIYPWKTLVKETLTAGKMPFWNPYNFSGAPLLANIQSSIFYPLNALFYILPIVTAWTITILFQPLLAGFFTYLFARAIGIGKIGSCMASIAYSYSLFMAVFLQYNTIGHTIALLPLLLYAGEKFLKKPRFWPAFVMSFGVAFTILSGHLQIGGFVIAFVALYFLFRTGNLRSFLPFTFFIIAGLGVSAVQLFPTFELIQSSARVPQNYQFLIEKLLLQPSQLILLLSPDFFGNPATRNYLIPDTYPGNALYIGLIPFILSLFAFIHMRKNAVVRFFLVSSGVLLLFLVRTPFTELFYHLEIPFLSTGSPTNALFLLAFGLSILSGFGLESWLKNKDKKYQKISIAFLAFFVLLWSFLLLARPETASLKNVLYSTGVFSSFLVLFFIAEKFARKKFLIACLLILVTVFDLFYFFQKFNPFVDKSLVFPDAPILTYLSNTVGTNRIWGYGSGAIEANFATQYNLFSPDGYDPLYPKRYGEFLQSSGNGTIPKGFTNQTRSDAVVAPGFGETDMSSNLFRLRVLRVLGVKYILDRVENGSTEKTFPGNQFALVYNQDGWRIFENHAAVPRVFLASDYKTFKTQEEFSSLFFDKNFDPSKTILLEEDLPHPLGQSASGSQATIVRYQPNNVTIETKSDATQLLFLSDTYYPGWKALVDGAETKIYRADYIFRAVVVPAGDHTVEFGYEPTTFSLGAKTTIISVVLILIFSLYLSRIKHA